MTSTLMPKLQVPRLHRAVGPWIAVATCAGLILAAGCTSDDGRPAHGVELVQPGDGGGARAAVQGAQGKPHSFGAVMVCLSEPGSVVIKSVSVYGGGGDLKVLRFALKPGLKPDEPFRLGAIKGPLESLGYDPRAPATVTTVCRESDSAESTVRVDTSQSLTELAVEYERASAGTAWSDGLELVYFNGRSEGRLKIPFGVTLCAVKIDSPDCDKAPVSLNR